VRKGLDFSDFRASAPDDRQIRAEPIVASAVPFDPEHAIGDPRRFAADLTTAGFALRHKGNVDEAIDCLERALAIFQHLGLPDDHPHVRLVSSALAQLRA
jgi:hypothetical protein